MCVETQLTTLANILPSKKVLDPCFQLDQHAQIMLQALKSRLHVYALQD